VIAGWLFAHNRGRHLGWALALTAFFLVIAFFHLESTPPLWWDEGWTLSVARNWVEHSHYGQFRAGVPAPGGLEAAFPLTGLVALSFRLLGVGVLQGRLVGVLFACGVLGLLYILGSRLYCRPVGWGALFVLLFLTGHPQINPLLSGRQVLADVPVVFYLLAGYLCFYWAFQRPLIFLPLAAITWGVALNTKAQALPFWLFSLVVPLVLVLMARRWRVGLFIGLAIILSLTSWQLVGWLTGVILLGQMLPGQPVEGLFSVVVVVPDKELRLYALSMALLFALPLIAGLSWTTWCFLKMRSWKHIEQPENLLQLALLVLSGSWFAWYLLLSNGSERYLATPVALGSLFTAKMLYDFSHGYQVRATVGRVSGLLTGKDRSLAALGGSFALLLVVYGLVIAGLTYWITLRSADTSVQIVADALNRHVPAGSLVESYDSEIFFFLNQPYHYPPDQVHGDLLRRYLLDAQYPIAYNPLSADPDYLVVGPVSAKWGLYAETLAGGAFRPLLEQGSYTIYERIRP